MSMHRPMVARRRTATTTRRPSIRSCARSIRHKRSNFCVICRASSTRRRGCSRMTAHMNPLSRRPRRRHRSRLI
jgi:hypothetical protein